MICERLERRTGTDRRRNLPLSDETDQKLTDQKKPKGASLDPATGRVELAKYTMSGHPTTEVRYSSTQLVTLNKVPKESEQGNFRRREGRISYEIGTRVAPVETSRGDCRLRGPNIVLKPLFCQARSRIIDHHEKTVLTSLIV